ncbi:MAG: ABC transporter permease [Balneolaceae bacterium]|nr:MAG: ABC transporter permease [Balneolaceae bacterium]
MKTILIIAWRNIWRHPARSGVLLAAVIAGLWAGVVTVGTMNGLLQQRVDYVIDSELAHVQIHHPEFLAERRPGDYIPGHQQIFDWLGNDDRVKAFSPRTMADGMIQSPLKTSGVRIRGIDVPMETQTTTFHNHLTEGDYLNAGTRNPILLGKALADDHKMEIGDRVVLFFEDTSGELTSVAFNIAGFFNSASTDYDQRNVLVRSSDLMPLLAGYTHYHEIAISLHGDANPAQVAADLNAAFQGIEAETWRELSPELNTLVELGGVMLYIVTIVIMLALAFGILNTMLMALFERMREIGMLMSIGMSRSRVFMMILIESIILTLGGALAGMLLAWGSIYHLSGSGVNFGMFADGIAELGWDHMIYPVLSMPEYITILGLVVFVTMISSLYPAIKAIRINPLEAAKQV